jgi:phenylacetyl-CoA:acceptor oxidoreductase 26-kDa subunit
MSAPKEILDRVAPRQQTDWDIRGALNFILGGAGGGLLFATALATGIDHLRPLIFLGMMLVGGGLYCVWLKIGQPWRALNVVRNPFTSWMTREAMIAPVIFLLGFLCMWANSLTPVFATGLAGLAFLYAQGRILQANIGIPAWRHQSLARLIIVTSMAEGMGIVCMASLFWSDLAIFAYLLVFLVLVRFILWWMYRTDLTTAGAPKGTMDAFDAMEPRFTLGGHVAPVALGYLAGHYDSTLLAFIAGALALAAGSWFKYVLVCEAAFTQGFALPRTPSRGDSAPGAGVKPGWREGKAG